MRLPRVRFTVRGMMIAVAVAGYGFWLVPVLSHVRDGRISPEDILILSVSAPALGLAIIFVDIVQRAWRRTRARRLPDPPETKMRNG